MTRLLAALAVVAVLAIGVSTANAVQYGTPDNNRHPWVGLMLAYDSSGAPLWRCTGSLISPKRFLVAAHCVEAPAARVGIWFDENVDDRPVSGYPLIANADATGTPVPHPSWTGALTIPATYDVGMVVLDAPVIGLGFGQLAPAGYLNDLATKRGLQNVAFTVTGYGLQSVKPVQMGVRYRMTATVYLTNLRSQLTRGFNVHYTSNPGERTDGSGGTCFGDSGGPVIHEGKIVAVNSFVLNVNCKGAGFGYRTDTTDSLGFINSFAP